MYWPWGGCEVNECCCRVGIGGNVLIDDVGVVGCDVNIDDNICWFMLVRVRCDSMRLLIEVKK